MSGFDVAVGAFFQAILDNAIGGRVLRAGTLINIIKLACGPVALALMVYYNCWTFTAKLYGVLHGSYGIMWVVKDHYFPDAQWNTMLSPVAVVLLSVWPLGLYWLPAYLITSQRIEVGEWHMLLAVVLFVFGSLWHFGSDCQKYFTLANRKGLITDGFFRATRNPNYLGEMMIYASFNILARNHWIAWVHVLSVWLTLFRHGMVKKDVSLSRHPEFARYSQTSGFLLPKVF